MSCRPTAVSVSCLLFLTVQSVHLTHAARSGSSLSGFEPPEIDGFPVDICRIFFVPTPAPTPTPTTTTPATTTPTTTTTTTTTTETTTPITKKVVTTTKKPAAQRPARKPETKNTGTPMRPQPAPAGPITDSLLYYLLANGRGHAAAPLPGFNSFISRPMGSYDTASDSDESGAALVKRAGRTDENRRRIGSLSSEDSSDEY